MNLKYWILAARPKTLTASVMPVLTSCAITWKEEKFNLIPSLICFVFAVIAQIVSNYLNDYYDFKKGADRSDRLGPERAVAKGWIAPRQMLTVSVALIAFACLLGCVLMFYAGWQLLFVGLAVGIGVFAYSAGPYPLAYRGWGDLCVLIFYGIIPVVFTCYVQTREWSTIALVCGIALGIVSVNILVANNYRDREQDRISKKNTTVVLFGEKFAEYFYLINGIAAIGLVFIYFLISHNQLTGLITAIYLIPHGMAWKKMRTIRQGKALNRILELSAQNTVIFGILLIATILLV